MVDLQNQTTTKILLFYFFNLDKNIYKINNTIIISITYLTIILLKNVNLPLKN